MGDDVNVRIPLLRPRPIHFSLACALALLTSIAGAQVMGSDQGQNQDYDQPNRPQVHFSPRENWTNDPNGLVYFHGEIPPLLSVQSLRRSMGSHELGTCRQYGSAALESASSRNPGEGRRNGVHWQRRCRPREHQRPVRLSRRSAWSRFTPVIEQPAGDTTDTESRLQPG